VGFCWLPAQGGCLLRELLLAGAQLAGLRRIGALSLAEALHGGGPVGWVTLD
jgi:hypothetical protein